MGLCETKHQKNRFSTIRILNDTNFPKIAIYLSTEILLRLKSQCIIFFVDSAPNLKNNQFLIEVGKNQANKMSQYLIASLNNRQLLSGEYIIYKNALEEMKFDYIAVMCLEPWKVRRQSNITFIESFSKLLDELNQRQLNTLVMTEIGLNLGYPSNITSKYVLHQIYQKQKYTKLKTLTLLFHKEDDRKIYSQEIKKFNIQDLKSQPKN